MKRRHHVDGMYPWIRARSDLLPPVAEFCCTFRCQNYLVNVSERLQQTPGSDLKPQNKAAAQTENST